MASWLALGTRPIAAVIYTFLIVPLSCNGHINTNEKGKCLGALFKESDVRGWVSLSSFGHVCRGGGQTDSTRRPHVVLPAAGHSARSTLPDVVASKQNEE
jgi:hypothetical protein